MKDHVKNPKTRADDLLKLSREALGELGRLERCQAEVSAGHTAEIKIVYENQDFTVSASSSTAVYGVRAIVDGRIGFATCNTDTPEALREAAREAQSIARLSVPNEFNRIASGGRAAHEELCDPKLLSLPPKRLYALAERIISEARRDPRVSIDRSEIKWSVSAGTLLNSAGVERSRGDVSCHWFIMGMGKQGSEVTSFDYDGSIAAREEDVEAEIDRSVGRFRDSVVGSLGVRRGESYKGAVLFHPNEALSLVGGMVMANCNALRHQDGISSWKDRVGERVASEMIDVYEDPLDRARAGGWNPFDREGVSTARHHLMRAGKLEFLAQNCFSAARGGAKPTGNASGGPGTLPDIGFSNVAVRASSAAGGAAVSDEEIAKRLGRGLVLKRFSGNFDPVSGNFSGTAKNSWWVEGGERAYPVHEVMVSGNLFDALDRIVAVGAEPHDVMGGGLAPYVLVDGLSVTAG